MKIELPDKLCSGCTACVSACPKQCITMEPDSKGFLYPVIHSESCVECGRCMQICPMKVPVSNIRPMRVLAARTEDREALEHSASGGVAWAMMCNCIERGGVVFGAALNEDLEVVHILVEASAELPCLQGSKYVQSRLGDTFQRIKAVLEQQREVLFIGTPCQVAGLRATLRGHERGLLTCDLICHGVPSPKLWRDHIQAIEKESGKRVKDYRFRDKTIGWHYNMHRTVFQDGSSTLHTYWNQCFKRLFFLDLIERPSCYQCPYASIGRVGDVTLGDYWGIEVHTERFGDDRGVNSVYINTEKGQAAVKRIEKSLVYMEMELEDALQKNLVMPTSPTPEIDRFWTAYRNDGYVQAAEAFAGKRHTLIIRNGVKDYLEKHRMLEVIKRVVKR